MAKKGFFAGLKFYADVEGSGVKYHCFFRGRESSSGRAEQYFMEYRGEIKSFEKLASQVKREMEKQYEGFQFARNQEDDFLWDLVNADMYEGLKSRRIKDSLENNRQIEFKVGKKSHQEAARLIKSLMAIETHSGDKHATIGLAENFSRIKEPEIAIKIEDSAKGIEGPHIKRNEQKSRESEGSSWRDKLPF